MTMVILHYIRYLRSERITFEDTKSHVMNYMMDKI